MLRASIGLLSLAVVATTFEPARLESGSVQGIPVGAAAAGLVFLDVAVNARGSVTGIEILQGVDPFTDVMRDSVQNWRFLPARNKRISVDSHLLVAGLFRPAMLMFPEPDVKALPTSASSEAIPLPTDIAVPPYPPNAIGSAYVLVEVELGEDGVTRTAKVMSPSSGFDNAALDAARGWTFSPALFEGREVPARVYIVFAFRQPN
jgi:TonB family protein